MTEKNNLNQIKDKIGTTENEALKNKLKHFYKDITQIIEYLDKLMKDKKETENTTYIKGIVKSESAIVKKLKEYIKAFKKTWNFNDTEFTTFIENSDNKKIIDKETLIKLKYIFIKLKKDILEHYENIRTVKKITDEFKREYKEAIDEIKKNFIAHYKTIGKGTDTDTVTGTVTATQVPYNITVGPRPSNRTISFTSKYNYQNLVSFLDNYSRGDNESKIEKIIKKIQKLETITDIEELQTQFKSILKGMFYFMTDYYYDDVNHKYRWTYKTLNNSYQKSKIKGFWKKSKETMKSMGRKIPLLSRITDNHKSKIHLGMKYKINPFFGFTKKISTKPIKELSNYVTLLIKQINTYTNLIQSKERNPKRDFDYYKLKKMLAKEIRKIKIIRYFLLEKTIKTKRKKNVLGIGKDGINKKHLVNTITTLKDKIKHKIKKLKLIPQTKTFITNTLSNPSSILSNIQKAYTLIQSDKRKWSQFQTLTKNRTEARLKLLTNMVKAEDLIKKIDTVLDAYLLKDRTDSTAIKTAINSNESKSKTDFNALKKVSSTSSGTVIIKTKPIRPPTPNNNAMRKQRIKDSEVELKRVTDAITQYDTNSKPLIESVTKKAKDLNNAAAINVEIKSITKEIQTNKTSIEKRVQSIKDVFNRNEQTKEHLKVLIGEVKELLENFNGYNQELTKKINNVEESINKLKETEKKEKEKEAQAKLAAEAQKTAEEKVEIEAKKNEITTLIEEMKKDVETIKGEQQKIQEFLNNSTKSFNTTLKTQYNNNKKKSINDNLTLFYSITQNPDLDNKILDDLTAIYEKLMNIRNFFDNLKIIILRQTFEAAAKQAEEEAVRVKAEEEAARVKAEEEAARVAADQAAEAARVAADQAAEAARVAEADQAPVGIKGPASTGEKSEASALEGAPATVASPGENSEASAPVEPTSVAEEASSSRHNPDPKYSTGTLASATPVINSNIIVSNTRAGGSCKNKKSKLRKNKQSKKNNSNYKSKKTNNKKHYKYKSQKNIKTKTKTNNIKSKSIKKRQIRKH